MLHAAAVSSQPYSFISGQIAFPSRQEGIVSNALQRALVREHEIWCADITTVAIPSPGDPSFD
jgi:hypothetical protein